MTHCIDEYQCMLLCMLFGGLDGLKYIVGIGCQCMNNKDEKVHMGELGMCIGMDYTGSFLFGV